MEQSLSEITIKYKNLKHLRGKLDLSKKQHTWESINLEKLKIKLVSEYQDVETLEKTTFKSLWFDLLNKKLDALEKEKAEYYQAKLNFEAQKDKVEQLAIEIEDFEKKVLDFDEVKAEYHKLIAEEINNHKKSASPISDEISNLQKEKVSTKLEMFEVEEALNATSKVLELIPDVANELKSAKMYSTWDIMGGGVFSTYLKRKKMTSARQGILDVNYALNKLKRELKDINKEHFPEHLGLDLSWEFVDYFFDNIFTDYNIGQKISSAYNSCISVYNSLLPIEESLRKEKLRLENGFNELEIKLEEMILKTL